MLVWKPTALSCLLSGCARLSLCPGMPPSHRRPVRNLDSRTVLVLWQRLLRKMFWFVDVWMRALTGVNMVTQKPALMSNISKQYEQDNDDLDLAMEPAIRVLTTAAMKTATKDKGSYPNQPATCKHPGKLRGYNAPAKGGVRSNYRICDMCGSRWQQQGENWVPIEPRTAPGARSPPGPAPSKGSVKKEAWTGRPAVMTDPKSKPSSSSDRCKSDPKSKPSSSSGRSN